MINLIRKNVLYIAWAQAFAATLGSLIFSEILQFSPCVLCWYQRAMMYPLVFVIGVGILRRDKNLFFYAIPLVVVGWLIAIYHNLLYLSLIPENITPCVTGISCTTQFIQWFGFITIPFLSFSAFSIIGVCMIIYARINKLLK